MKIILAGAKGYIGSQLIPRLLAEGHIIYILAKDETYPTSNNIILIQGDLLDPGSIKPLPEDLDIAFYLSDNDHEKSAHNFSQLIFNTTIHQIIHLSCNNKNVEDVLKKGIIPVTTLKTGMILGEGSPSLKIIQNLVEKLPIIPLPKLAKNKIQPIIIDDLIKYLLLIVDSPDCIGQDFEISGPNTLTLIDLLHTYATSRKLNRAIFSIPLQIPKLFSYLIYWLTHVNSEAFVQNLIHHTVYKDHKIKALFPFTQTNCEEWLKKLT